MQIQDSQTWAGSLLENALISSGVKANFDVIRLTLLEGWRPEEIEYISEGAAVNAFLKNEDIQTAVRKENQPPSVDTVSFSTSAPTIGSNMGVTMLLPAAARVVTPTSPNRRPVSIANRGAVGAELTHHEEGLLAPVEVPDVESVGLGLPGMYLELPIRRIIAIRPFTKLPALRNWPLCPLPSAPRGSVAIPKEIPRCVACSLTSEFRSSVPHPRKRYRSTSLTFSWYCP